MSDHITEDLARHVATLSRLEFSSGELQRLAREMNDILGYIDKLNQLDTSNVEPTSHALKLKNVFREDQLRPSLSNNEALSNAPERAGENGEFFKVPQVLPTEEE